jgi:hypothetical protein
MKLQTSYQAKLKVFLGLQELNEGDFHYPI